MRPLTRALALVVLCLCWTPSLQAQPTTPTPPTTTSPTAVDRLVRISGTYHPADGQAAAAVETVMVAIYGQAEGGRPCGRRGRTWWSRARGATRAHFGHREHPDRSMMNAQIGAS